MEKQWSLESIDTDGNRVDFVISRLPCRVGRSKDNDLVIANLGLSRLHAILVRDISGPLRLIDENSTNGTFVDGKELKAMEAVRRTMPYSRAAATTSTSVSWGLPAGRDDPRFG